VYETEKGGKKKEFLCQKAKLMEKDEQQEKESKEGNTN